MQEAGGCSESRVVMLALYKSGFILGAFVVSSRNMRRRSAEN